MKNIYEQAVKLLPPEQIDHDTYGSDLYLMVSPQSKKLIDNYCFKDQVTTFFSNFAPHILWYDIPFAYTPYWDDKCKNT